MEQNTNRESKVKFLGEVIVLPLQALSHHRDSHQHFKALYLNRCLKFNITHVLVVAVESTPSQLLLLTKASKHIILTTRQQAHVSKNCSRYVYAFQVLMYQRTLHLFFKTKKKTSSFFNIEFKISNHESFCLTQLPVSQFTSTFLHSTSTSFFIHDPFQPAPQYLRILFFRSRPSGPSWSTLTHHVDSGRGFRDSRIVL